MTKREKVDLSRRILDTAAELFYPEGVRSVGVDRIAAESGVAKMTLYYHYRSKDELVAAWLRRRDDEWMSWLAGAVERGRGNRLLAVFETLREWFETPRSAAAPSSTRTPSWGGATRRRRRSSPRTSGSSPSTWRASPGRRVLAAPDADTLARELLLLVDGAIITASIQGDARVADEARGAAAKVIAGYTLTPDASATL